MRMTDKQFEACKWALDTLQGLENIVYRIGGMKYQHQCDTVYGQMRGPGGTAVMLLREVVMDEYGERSEADA